MKKVVEETKTPLIDMHKLSGELYQRLGSSAQTQLGSTKTDTTHFGPEGEKSIELLVAQALGQAVPALRPYLIAPQ